MSGGKAIILIVEDELSEAVMRKVIARHAISLEIDRCIISGGVGNIKIGMQKYMNASNVLPHVVLADLDQHDCASALMTSWGVRELPRSLLFRIAVRSIESWLLADQQGIADFLSIASVKVRQRPEELVDSKRELVSLARRGRQRRLASEVCPEPGSAAKQGPLYNAHLVRFVRESWRVDVAARSAPSLARACQRLGEFQSRLQNEY